MLRMVRLLAAFAVAASMAACGGVDSPSSQTATPFSGTLAPGDQQFTTFSVSKTGEMQLTLESLNPRPVVGFLSMGIGQQTGSICSPIFGYIVSQAAVGQQYSFPQITKGTYCVVVADANLVLTQPAAFSIRLLHP